MSIRHLQIPRAGRKGVTHLSQPFGSKHKQFQLAQLGTTCHGSRDHIWGHSCSAWVFLSVSMNSDWKMTGSLICCSWNYPGTLFYQSHPPGVLTPPAAPLQHAWGEGGSHGSAGTARGLWAAQSPSLPRASSLCLGQG